MMGGSAHMMSSPEQQLLNKQSQHQTHFNTTVHAEQAGSDYLSFIQTAPDTADMGSLLASQKHAARSIMSSLMSTNPPVSSPTTLKQSLEQRTGNSRGTHSPCRQRPASATTAPEHAKQTQAWWGSARLSLEVPKHRNDVEYTKKPLGNPAVRELNPQSASQVIRLKHRAATLIQRYAGKNWQAAQRTKWMLDVVTHIDKDYREYMMDQARQIQHLQQQIELMQSSQAGALAVAQDKVGELEELARQQQAQLRDQGATILDLQSRLVEGEAALQVAEQQADAAAQEMGHLHQAVAAMTEHDARSRKMLSTRAYELKDSLRTTQARLRHSTEIARRHNMEVAAKLQLRDEEVARERAGITNQYMSQLAAVHQVERAVAQVEVTKLKMELEAYKEPWTYTYGKRSPTKDPVVTKTLGLKPSSLQCIVQTVKS